VVATESTVLKHHIVTTIDFVVTPNHWRHVLGERSGPKDTVTSNRLHRQHSPTACFVQSRQLQANLQGVNFGRRSPGSGGQNCTPNNSVAGVEQMENL